MATAMQAQQNNCRRSTKTGTKAESVKVSSMEEPVKLLTNCSFRCLLGLKDFPTESITSLVIRTFLRSEMNKARGAFESNLRVPGRINKMSFSLAAASNYSDLNSIAVQRASLSLYSVEHHPAACYLLSAAWVRCPKPLLSKETKFYRIKNK